MQNSGIRVQGVRFGCRVQGTAGRVQGSGCRVQGSGCRVQGSGCRVQGEGAEFRAQIWGFSFRGAEFRVRVQDFGFDTCTCRICTGVPRPKENAPPTRTLSIGLW